MFSHLYDERKAVDAAMYLLVRARAPMNVVKLNRLLYLAERESFAQHAEPLTGDQLQVFETSPVLFATYQRLAGDVAGWEDRISYLANHEVEVRRPIMSETPEEYFDHSTKLSNAEIAILDSIWEKFGERNHFALTDYLHMSCHEWTDKQGNPTEVSHKRLLRELNYSDPEITEIMSRLGEIAQINAVLTHA
ncbi:Panacea domain-containing protein [Burkholderia catarinensis]|uniref:Panacea domain-containing protein n=1 Tax=Burkholderia catarinensis TaxID=1108140 RepID=UPI000918D6CD|nr:Panacea domain-containing protein [Burkholderia catarinensis]KAG8152163.1 hypothetical protein BFF94_018375 [Burkholderia catarinensis]